jgi:twitching motility protein PilT
MQYDDIEELMKIAVDHEASDLHIKAGSPPSIRLKGGQLVAVDDDMPPLNATDTEYLIKSVMEEHNLQAFEEEKELDFAYDYSSDFRFRVNVFLQRKSMGAVFRLIPVEVPTIEHWGLPDILKDLAVRERGFILLTGPTGYGKSTTLAAMIDHINHNQRRHVVTLEDPIEFIFKDDLSRITQREVGGDTHSFDHALGRVLRQDPDVILVGEMRDFRTIGTAITAAETGHLVMSTLHTNSAAETIDRIIDVFPPHQQQQVRVQLSLTLEAVLCQTLVPRKSGFGRIAVFEIMIGTPAIRNLIREGETHQIINVIQTSASIGMQTRDQALRELYEKGIIDLQTAIAYATYPEELKRAMMWSNERPAAVGNNRTRR